MVSSALLGFATPPIQAVQRAPRRPAVVPVLASLLLLAAVTTPVVPAQQRAGASASVTVAPDEAAALAAARAQGSRVEALSDRTEFSQTFANPSGTMTLEQSPVPVRVHRPDGSWAPVDTTLRVGPDGAVSPAAAVADVSFSSGGGAPLARIAKDGRELTFSWPAPLPAPVLSGDTATYPDVLPGVDLQVTAHPLGFSDLLVVRTPAAAANPALADVRFGVGGSGLSVRTTAAGGLTAVDPAGREVFAAPAPAMWDGSGSRAHVGMTVAGGWLDLAPDVRLLTGAGTRFPISIDPYVTVTGVLQAWTKVDACFPDQTYWNGANDSDPNKVGAMKVGRAPIESGDPCNGTLWRTYFRMDTSKVKGKIIGGASFNAFETWATSCASKPADLYATGAISSSTDWNAQPSASFLLEKSFAHGHSSSCARNWESFDVKEQVADGASAGSDTLTLMLRAPNEGVCNANSTQDTCEWKRFDSGAISHSDTAFLSIQYDTPPNAPTALFTNGSPYLYPNGQIPCNSSANYVNTATPTMHADISDPDDTASSQPQPLTATYTFSAGTATGTVKDPSSGSGLLPGSGHTSVATSASIPAGTVSNGSSVQWHVVTSDGITNGPVSANCHLTIDTTAETASPGITSTDGKYPPGGANPPTPVGTPGSFTPDPGGSTDVAGYLLGINTSTPWKFVRASGTGNTAAVTVDPIVVGDNSLVARIVGLGGNLGPIASYDVITGHSTTGSVLLAHYGMDEGTGSAVADSTGGHDATAAGSFGWTTGQTGASSDHALHLTSSPGGYAATKEPAVDTQTEYTVSAWVKLDDANALYHVLTQDGVTNEAFALEYLKGDNRWAFSAAESDSTNPVIDHALSDAAPVVGKWTHLVGVFCPDPSCLAPGDTAPGRLFLYVDTGSGLTLQASQPVFASSWMSTGGLEMGRGKFNGAEANYLNGAIDDVSVYWGDPCPQPAAPPAVSTCGIG